MVYPYNDDYLVYNPITRRYRVTELALLQMGIDLRSRISRHSAVAPDNIINGVCEDASKLIYSFIHKHNADTALQDIVIARCPAVRPILLEALVDQTIYVIKVGDLTLSDDPAKRAMAISETAAETLGNCIPELGHSLLYQGPWTSRW